jgi:glutathione peroxidase-family protein
MTVKERLIASGYVFEPQTGCWVNADDKKGLLYSYLQDPESVGDDDIWNFEKVDQDGNLVEQHIFTEYSFINY